jgi:uncharacterized NAD(P)/FAD-binding protein YdhS
MDTPESSTPTALSARVRRFERRSREVAPPPQLRTIAIVGAGFSGTVLALNLLRLPHERPLRIVLVDREPMGRGVAYARRRYPYLLNVPAGRMSASSADPEEFLAFARRKVPGATGEDFLPRELYGDYLESSLATAALAAPPHVRLDRLHASVIALERLRRSAVIQAHLNAGRRLSADTIVLALGNLPPAPLEGSEALRGLPGYIENPWAAPVAFRPGETVLIAGTGLTMADVALAGSEAANGRAVIHALSRHGLLPPPQTAFRLLSAQHDAGALLNAATLSVRRLLCAVRALCADLELHGGDWREGIAVVRHLAPALWQCLPIRERARFLRHVRRYWDLHRHRLPESTWSALNALRTDGALHIHAGRLIGLEPAGRRIRVTWQALGKARRTLLVDRVVNCTGPDHDVRRTRERLLRSLVAQGTAVPDPLALGLATDEFGALIDTSGQVSRHLYCLGPLLRPKYWETTAVQELRVHAERLALHLAAPNVVLSSAVRLGS